MGSEPQELVAAARAVAYTARRLERSLGEMTLPQFRVLALVASSTERASQIAERAAVTRPSLTGLLDGLEARGWVRRVDVSGDRRGVLLEVTAEGREALTHAERSMAAALDDVLAPAGADDRARALRGLAALGGALRSRLAAAGTAVEAEAR